MKVNIVNYEGEGGILTKFARTMESVLHDMDIPVTVSTKPDKKADVNHHINYLPYTPQKGYSGIDTLMITHIDSEAKKKALQAMLKTAHGVCFSKETAEQFKGTSVILPAHDGHPRKPLIIAILTKVYPDGRKREEMFTQLCQTLDPKKFIFFVVGDGWQPILEPLGMMGFQISYDKDFDYETNQKLLNMSDYLLYFGKDEGAISVLEATNAGLKTIAPLVGFHKEIGIDYPFDTQAELNSIFAKLSHNPVEDWTWEKYVKEHVTLWEKLLAKKR